MATETSLLQKRPVWMVAIRLAGVAVIGFVAGDR